MDEFFALNRLSAYLDGDLSEAEAAEVARAIEENPEVRAAWEEMRASVAFLRRHGPVPAPARLHMKVMAAVEALPTPASPLARLRALLARMPLQAVGVAAVAALVLVVAWRLPDRGVPQAERAAAAPEPAPPEETASAPAPDEAPPAKEDAGEIPDTIPLDLPPGSVVSTPEPIPTPIASRAAQTQGTGSARPAAEGGGAATGAGRAAAVGPDNPYIPAWETQGTAGEPAADKAAGVDTRGLLVSPFVYRLFPEDPDALRRLAALAARLGGSLVTPSGEPVDPYVLTVERNHAAVVLRVPAESLESVEPTLRRLGGVLAVQADAERLYSGTTVDVGIEVLYQP